MDALKLAKVLAMAASDNDVEALHALRTARRLLDAHGSDFVELAERLAKDDGKNEALEDAMFDLRNEVRHLRAENERLRQGRASPAAPGTGSFHDAAREAAELIRLRAELDGAKAETQRVLAHEATLQEQFRQALTEAGDLGLRLSEAQSRRMRLEAENRRLSHANHALKLELAETIARSAPVALVDSISANDRIKGRKGVASAKGREQYALF